MENSERYQIWLYPSGITVREEQSERVDLALVDSIRYVKIDPDEMDLPDGVILYDADSVEPVNMAATGLADLPSMTAIRGRVLFGTLQEDGTVETVFDAATADWIELWAEGRCTVCGCKDKPVRFPAFPVSTGRCCGQCSAVMRSLRQYMGIGSWKPKEQK